MGLTGSQSNYAYGNHAYTATPVGNIFEWDGSYPEPVWGSFRPLGDDRTRQTAVYGALRLSLADGLKLIIGGREASLTRRRVGYGVMGAFVLASIGVFAFFHPIYVADVIPLSEWQARMWFPSWV